MTLPQPLPPTILRGYGVILEPLKLDHVDGLRRAAGDGALWELKVTSVPTREGTEQYIMDALAGQKNGVMLPFTVREEQSGEVIGCTRYHDVIASVDRVEIGYTWYAKSRQRTHVNTACKQLLLTHAFDSLRCAVVGWRTDILNLASQRAIERLGARRDGVLRHHALRRDGTVRDTVMYSLLAAEWPAVEARLAQFLATPPPKE